MAIFTQTDLKSIERLRIDYFTEIELPQELFMEWLVPKSIYYKIKDGKTIIGYFI